MMEDALRSKSPSSNGHAVKCHFGHNDSDLPKVKLGYPLQVLHDWFHYGVL